jgi:L-aminopeptidase/D-esterase-like protein
MLKITDIASVEVGHATHAQEKTGCTVLLCREGAVAGIDIRGSAPGTRETELLRPTMMVRQVHAIMLSGGSAFGLRTADGAMSYLAEHGIGYNARGVIVPIIPAAIIFDLAEGRNPAYPGAEMGYQACQNAGKTFEEGLVGAGRGATVGKILGREHCMSGGFASAALELPNGVRVGAAVVVNALGDIIDPASGKIVAGARRPGGGFMDAYQLLLGGSPGSVSQNLETAQGTNTTLAVVATDAQFNKEEITKIAQMAQNGITRATRPAHTLSLGKKLADISLVGEAAAHTVSAAILRAVRISNALE